MKNILILILVEILIIGSAGAKHLYPEKHYQAEWCGKWNGQQEYKLRDNTRVDCLTVNYAVEFDFAPKWAESIGQALYYGKMTGRKPAIILIIEKPSDWKYYNRLKTICKDNKVTLWYVKSPFYGKANKSNVQIDYDNFFKEFKKVFNF